MKVLILTQIYYPEMGALANRIYPIVRELSAAGHDVSVATGMPNYPAGRVFPAYRGKFVASEKRDDCTIYRTAYLTVPRNRSKVSQLISYLTFIPAVFLSAFRAGPVDVVFVTSPPIFPVLAAIVIARLRGARLVFDVRDLLSDELVTYGGSGKSSIPVSVVRGLEWLGYRHADLISCTTRSLEKTVVERGADAEKTFLLPNGADLDIFYPRPRVNPISNAYGFEDRFVVMYSGLFGIKHGLEVLLQAALHLRDRKDICFFLLGNGARKTALTAFARDQGLDNVIIGSERPVEEVPHVLARADLCFAACRPEPYPKKLISVKIFEYLACEKPVVGSFEGESARILNESGGGIVVTPGDSRLVADAIAELHKDPERRARMGRSGRRYVKQNFSRSTWASKFEVALTTLVDPAQNSKSMDPAALQSDRW